MRIECNGDRVSMSKNEYNQVINELNQFKKQCDTCLEDIEKLRNKLEGAETYIDAIKTYYPMYESLRKRYTALANHIRTKAEKNPGVSRYIDLVNFIDRLERK